MDREIKTTEMHCGGGAVRIIDSGFPKLTQPTLLGKRREVTEKHDKIRSYLLSEPRGHSDLYGVVPCDSELEEADLGVLLMHNAGMGIMCGHAIMAVARYAVDKGIVKRAHDPSGTSVNIHCPCGLVKTTVLPDNSVTFISVPSFVAISGLDLRLSSGRQVKVDIVFGGTFYALLDSTQLGIHISEEPICQLTQLGEEIKNLVNSTQKTAPSRVRRFVHLWRYANS
ncbi:hypothetical protein EB796_005320 [Bugula neritina]|uniref:trans-L-3-hydroxyproline dehydratase n=1 Tax=Bugula neritina TaxID=10212 RepID=A0A7J7KDU5_BUGNE|nr:hypothetical protein EB796_005320 [Bugula neritina]